jgi:hypothetical protein
MDFLALIGNGRSASCSRHVYSGIRCPRYSFDEKFGYGDERKKILSLKSHSRFLLF